MSLADKHKDPHVEFVKTEFGWSIRFRDPDSSAQYLPPPLAEAKRAFAEAKRKAEAEMSTR